MDVINSFDLHITQGSPSQIESFRVPISFQVVCFSLPNTHPILFCFFGAVYHSPPFVHWSRFFTLLPLYHVMCFLIDHRYLRQIFLSPPCGNGAPFVGEATYGKAYIARSKSRFSPSFFFTSQTSFVGPSLLKVLVASLVCTHERHSSVVESFVWCQGKPHLSRT